MKALRSRMVVPARPPVSTTPLAQAAVGGADGAGCDAEFGGELTDRGRVRPGSRWPSRTPTSMLAEISFALAPVI
ncbi:hypothetical protein GCM10029992_62770 [Glycomyces albus]